MRLIALLLLATSAALAAPVPKADLATPVDGPYDVTFALAARGPQQALLLDWDKSGGIAVNFGEKSTTVVQIWGPSKQTLATGPAVTPGSVRLKRRFPVIEISGPQGLFLRVYSRRPISGSCAPATGAKLPDFTVQPVDLIAFSDEFFNPEGGESVWEPQSGQWTIGTYRDPLKALENRPIAASWYQCQADGRAVSLTGQDFWDNYRVRAAVRASATVASGLVLYDNGQRGGYVFRVRPQAGGQGLAELMFREKVLSSAPVAWREGNWYELAVEVCGDDLACFVQGRGVASTWQRALVGGRAGLGAFGKGVAQFDDFSVTSLQRVKEKPDWTKACWSGAWTLATPFCWFERLTAFSPDTVSARCNPSGGAAGVALNLSAKSGYALEVLPGSYRLSRVDVWRRTVLASGPVAPAAEYDVRLSNRDGRLEAQVGEMRKVVYDFTHSGGAAGCCGSGNARFSAFTASAEPPAITTISTVTGVRTPMPGENSDSRRFVLGFIWQPLGGNWTGVPGPETTRLQSKPYGQQPASLWYYQPCPGDAEVVTEELRLAAGGSAGLALACDKRDVLSGYRAETDGKTLKLYRLDKLLASAPLKTSSAELRLWRDGNHVAAQAGLQGLAHEDTQPLPGALCAAYATGAGMSVQQVVLSNRRASYYAFRSEETDWQPAQGEWMTHSGMACIPWDYWYTGKGNPQSLAWNARPQPADLHLDLWVGEYTEGYADGEHKHFPYHDISVVTSAAKQELDGGYRLLLGAEQGAVTRLLRLGKVVAETRDPACRVVMGSHCNTPRELHVVLHQQGGKLTLTVDDKRVLEYTDPQPLGAGHLGLGTTGCIANFRDLWLCEVR